MTTTLPVPANTAAPANGRASYLTPLANILENADSYVLEAELPGVSREGLRITVEDGELTFEGRRDAGAKVGQPLYRESRPLGFRRTVQLDSSIDSSRIGARLENGVLTLTLPKAESMKPREIAVE